MSNENRLEAAFASACLWEMQICKSLTELYRELFTSERASVLLESDLKRAAPNQLLVWVHDA